MTVGLSDPEYRWYKIPTREISAIVSLSLFFKRNARGPRKQVVLNIGVIHQTAEAEVTTIFSKFFLVAHAYVDTERGLCH